MCGAVRSTSGPPSSGFAAAVDGLMSDRRCHTPWGVFAVDAPVPEGTAVRVVSDPTRVDGTGPVRGERGSVRFTGDRAELSVVAGE